MKRHTKRFTVGLAAALVATLPYGLARADDTGSVTTPSQRHSTVLQSTPEQRQQQYQQRAQQAQQRAQTWRGETPDQRHQSYQQSAEQARSQAQTKANAAAQRKQTWSQMSTEEHQQVIDNGKQNVQDNLLYRQQQMQDRMQQRSGYGVSGWGGRQR